MKNNKNMKSFSKRADSLTEYLTEKANNHNCYKVYSTLERVVEIRDNQCIYLGTGNKWNDIADRDNFNSDRYNVVNFGKCFSFSQDENVAMWMLYGGIEKKSGMIDFTKKGMQNILKTQHIEVGYFECNKYISCIQLPRETFKIYLIDVVYYKKLFAALNSAKVMLVVGTKKEYLNAVWVKNEWSRYLALINGGAKKTLIPVYKDIDPYDLPEEFARLQAQDLSNLGSTQDIVRAVEKLVGNESENKANIEANSALKGMLENSYKKACAEMQKARTFVDYNKAAETFEIIMDYKDSANLYQECVYKSKALKEKMKKTLKIVKKISAIAAIVIAITTTLIFTWTYVSPALKSAYAKTMLFFGNYSEYYKTLIELDSVDTIDPDDIKDCLSEMVADSEIGDTIVFGTINEQPCVWRVLDKKEDRILVISENCIGTARQNSSYGNAAWKNSGVRAGLNSGHFGSLKFTSVEEPFILLSIVEATDNPKYSTQQGSSTEDKLFLLSTDEAEKYFDSDESRICYPITVNGISDISCSWGLRTVGSLIRNNAVVDSSGGIDYEGNSMTLAVNIRPAMWLSLDS